MRILSSSVSLAASVTTSVQEVRSERALLWTGEPPPPDGAGGATLAARRRATPATPAVPAHGDGPATPAIPATPAGAPQGREAQDGDPRVDGLSARDEIRLLILRRTFGLERAQHAARAIREAYADGAAQAAETGAEISRAEAAASPATAPLRAGLGLEVDVSVQRTEVTSLSFAAAAEVTTADGRHLETAASLELQRLSVTSAEVQLRAGDRRVPKDPLALNLTGAPVALDGTQVLDLDGDGEAEQVPQLAAGSAWLARDLDGSGAVESGQELFGPATGDGFAELAALDADGNGWVDEGDAAFTQLALWDGAQLTSLTAAQVGALYTGSAATPLDLPGGDGVVAGQLRESGVYLREDGTAGTVVHVDLLA